MNQQTLTIVWLVAIAAIFYFMILRPQQQRQKRHKELMNAIAIGDTVVTVGGMHGRVVELDESTMTLQIADGTRSVFELSSMARIATKEAESLSD